MSKLWPQRDLDMKNMSQGEGAQEQACTPSPTFVTNLSAYLARGLFQPSHWLAGEPILALIGPPSDLPGFTPQFNFTYFVVEFFHPKVKTGPLCY